MMKIASGGELSRFLLALKVALAQRVCFSVLIFDEIDTGVSGAVADAMGQRLLSLSQSVQVLAVTHAPQIAASADSHFIVLRNTPNSSGPTIQKLDFIERREEIARMLAGACITDEARAAASRLLSEKAESV